MDDFSDGKPLSNGGSEGHRRRLREKFLRGGLNAFLDYEIVELLLTLGTPRKDCKEQARQALKEFKSLRGVLEADVHDLQKIKGIGSHNIFGIRLVQEVSRRFLKEQDAEQALRPIFRAKFSITCIIPFAT